MILSYLGSEGRKRPDQFSLHQWQRKRKRLLASSTIESEHVMQPGLDPAFGATPFLLLEQVSLGMALFEARELRLLAANASYQAFLGPAWQHGQIIGRLLTELIPAPQ